MSARRALAAALLVPLALLSACAEDEPVPQMPDPTTVSPSPTESSSTAAPETPEEFMSRFNDANVKMQATGETGEFLALTQECRPCTETAQRVEGFYADGGYVKWTGWKILRVREAASTADNQVDLRLDVTSAPTKYKASDSSEVVTLEGGKATYQATLVSHDESWLISDLVELAQ